jgi:hypothetical protein
MKVLNVLLLLLAVTASAQVGTPSTTTAKTKEAGEDQVYKLTSVDTKPEYPGGIIQFYKFFESEFKTPEGAPRGNVLLTFVIEKDGSVSDVKAIRDVGLGTGEEAVRVMKLSPKWKPGMLKNEPVRVFYTLPVKVIPKN